MADNQFFLFFNRYRYRFIEYRCNYFPEPVLRMGIEKTLFPRLYRREGSKYQYSAMVAVKRSKRMVYFAHSAFVIALLLPDWMSDNGPEFLRSNLPCITKIDFMMSAFIRNIQLIILIIFSSCLSLYIRVSNIHIREKTRCFFASTSLFRWPIIGGALPPKINGLYIAATP